MISDTVGLILIFGISVVIIACRWYFGRQRRVSLRTDIIIGVLIVSLAGLVLLLIGRLPWCSCNRILLWSSDIFSENNSQQITDPYSFTHLIHGLAFYLLFWIFARRLPFGLRLIMAVALESIWEVIENSDMIIGYYRAETISLGYYGDSVINSISDIAMMVGGFIFSRKVPVWVSVLVFVLIEVSLALWIKDNLTLNVLMFIHPFEAIRNWQLGL